MPYALPPGSDPTTTGVRLQVDTPRLFSLVTPFWYAPDRPLPPALDAALPATPADAPDGDQRWLAITSADTDLASVPGMLWGLLASYGRHTLAVLVHDRLCAEADKATASRRFVARSAADEVFHRALRDPDRPDFQAPWFRSLVLWSGVSLDRYWRLNRAGFAVLIAAILGAWLAALWLLQSLPGPGQPVAAIVLLVTGLALLGVAGVADVRLKSAGRASDRWIVRALVTLVVLVLLAALWSSTPWTLPFGLSVPGWLGALGLVVFVAGSVALAFSPVRRDAVLPLLTATVGPWVVLVGLVTLVALYVLWIPDAFARGSGGPINTLDVVAPSEPPPPMPRDQG
ncbi:MAG: DUF1353 domain-containing protein [Micropruina sp.]|nr:DUF1353 domain-containing protein [Micropruina sp.]